VDSAQLRGGNSGGARYIRANMLGWGFRHLGGLIALPRIYSLDYPSDDEE